MSELNNPNDRILDILIATHGPDGLQRVGEMTLPHVDGVRYIVSWQTAAKDTGHSNFHYDIPAALKRDDVEIHPIYSIGTSNNHNASMTMARAKYCLLADNDLHYTAEGIESVCRIFDENPDIDVATFQHEGDNTYYPPTTTDLGRRLPKGYSVGIINIAYRRKRIGEIRFDPNFGICAPMAAGEDFLFLLDCRRKGLHCRFFPVTIVTHFGLSTGYRPITNPKVAAAEGACIRLEYGIAGYPRIPLFAWRARRSNRMPFFWGLWHLTRGFFSKYVRLHRRNHLQKKLH